MAVSYAGTLAAVAAGVLGVSAAGTAGGNAARNIGRPPWSTSGPPRAVVATVGQAGYVATGRRFRYAQAIITVPRQPCGPGTAQPRLYVALAGPSGSARAGLACAARPAGRAAPIRAGEAPWRAFISVAPGGPGTHTGHAGHVASTFPVGPVKPGQGVFVSVYFNRFAHAVRFALTMPDGASYTRSAAVSPATYYPEAQALAWWPGPAGATAVPQARPVREARFLSGAFTTLHGLQGTFTGPWKLARWEATSNGRPAGRLAAAPGYLSADGTQRVIGAWDDVFGVWLYR